MGAANGPFLCGMCRFFVDRRAPVRRQHDGACTKVTGVIQFYACCNLFSPLNKER